MKTLTGTFETGAHADDAIRALQQAGIAPGDISRDDENNPGGTLVTALVDEGQVDAAAAILNQASLVDIDTPANDKPISEFDELDPRSYRREDEAGGSMLIPPLPR